MPGRSRIPQLLNPDFKDMLSGLKEMDGMKVQVIGRDDLLVNKRASGRPKDLVDAATLDPPGGK